MDKEGGTEENFKGQMKSAKYTSKVSVTGNFTSRKFHTAVSYEDFMFVFAGCTAKETAMSDLAIFHYASRSWSTVENETTQKMISANTRYGQSAALYGDSMFVYGGTSERAIIMEDLLEFKFEIQSWQVIYGEGTKPGPRFGHTASVHENVMYVFGGLGIDDAPYNELYELNLDTFRWAKIEAVGTLPPGRYDHSSVVSKDSIFVFGGNSGTATLGDFWEYKIKSRTWSQISVTPCPSPREGHAAVVLQNSMYVLGGNPNKMEIFQFDFDYRKWYKVQPVGEGPFNPKQYHTAVVRGECIFMIGGVGDGSGDIDYLCVGRDDFEEEFEADEIAKMQALPKSSWEAMAMRRHPELLELRERLLPLSGGNSYSRNLLLAKTENKQSLSYGLVLQLIMEHLDSEGQSKAVEVIEEESGVRYQKQENQESRLLTLLRTGRRRIHKDLFNSDISIPDYDDADPEVISIDHLPRRLDDREEQDINIWNEPIESRRNVLKVKEENNDKVIIRAATLNKLVQYLTSEKEKSHDVNYMRIFLYTYQSFTTPEMLLKKLIQRYHVPLPKGMPEDKFKIELQQPIRNRVCTVMKFWLDKCGWDFQNEKMISLLNAFIDGPLSRDGNLSLVKQLRNSIGKLHRKKALEEERYVFGVNPPEPKVPKQIFSTALNINQVDEIEVARQLTLLEFNIFSQVNPTEFLNKSWSTPDLRHKAPHIMEMLNRFEELSNSVTTNILTSDVTNKKNRAKVIERWIKIAENLKTLKNFQSLFAVVSGLNSPFILRLGQTFAELAPRSREVLSDLSAIINKDNNYGTYREVLRFSATPCVPFLDVMLEDLSTIEIQHQDFVNGLINFQKRQFLYKAINQIQGYQSIPYNLQPVHQVALFLSQFVTKEADELKELSNKCEPPTK